MGTSSVLRLRVPVLILFLIALAFALAGRAPAARAQAAAVTTQFDGSYKGTFVLNEGGYVCENYKLEQTMLVSGDRVYLERKSAYQNDSLLLSGTISTDGSVSASGVGTRAENTFSSAGPGMRAGLPEYRIVYTLTGKIENNELTGTLSSRAGRCILSIKMKK